uniref:Uncharacterized protein n=1 Tax=Anguilla anguilla TaxID=7936 RepID=A0A0E9SPY3_ANGAN
MYIPAEQPNLLQTYSSNVFSAPLSFWTAEAPPPASH